MNAERAREFLLSLPHVVEIQQWGGLLYWLADKAIGGRTFAMLNLEAEGGLPVSFAAGPERFAELCEVEGMRPAPYSAKNFWVAAERWDALRNSEWEEELRAAHTLVFSKLLAKAKALLELPPRELKKAVAEQKRVLAGKAKSKTSAARD